MDALSGGGVVTKQNITVMVFRSRALLLTDGDAVELPRVWDRVRGRVDPGSVAQADPAGRRVLPGQSRVAVLRAEGGEGRLEERQGGWGRMELGRGHAQWAEAQQPGFPRVARGRQRVRMVRRVHGVGEQRGAVLAPFVVGFSQNQGIHEKRPRHVGGLVAAAACCVSARAWPVDSEVVLKAHRAAPLNRPALRSAM